MLGCLGRRERSSGIARARVRTLAVGAAVLAASLIVPTTLLAAQPGSEPDGSAAPPGATAPANPDQPAPPSSPAQPSPAPTDPVDGGPQSQPGAAPTDVSRGDRDRSAGNRPTPRLAVASSAAARSASVSIVGDTFSAFAFSPKSITVHVGDKVRWDNESAASEGHTVTGDGLDSGTFHQGDDYRAHLLAGGHLQVHLLSPPIDEGKGHRAGFGWRRERRLRIGRRRRFVGVQLGIGRQHQLGFHRGFFGGRSGELRPASGHRAAAGRPRGGGAGAGGSGARPAPLGRVRLGAAAG